MVICIHCYHKLRLQMCVCVCVYRTRINIFAFFSQWIHVFEIFFFVLLCCVRVRASVRAYLCDQLEQIY